MKHIAAKEIHDGLLLCDSCVSRHWRLARILVVSRALPSSSAHPSATALIVPDLVSAKRDLPYISTAPSATFALPHSIVHPAANCDI